MRNQITEGKEFNILSRSIDNATRCIVEEVKEDCFTVKLVNDGKYETDETVEMFSMTNRGQIYFETIVKEKNEDKLTLWFPITFKYLQRREYTRIPEAKDIKLIQNDEVIDAKIEDISAGGLKITAQKQLQLLSLYSSVIEVDNEEVKCLFEPIRIEANGEVFIISGRFKEISNHDRIALVQYCFKKQIENSNK